jgi:hypothetical protein
MKKKARRLVREHDAMTGCYWNLCFISQESVVTGNIHFCDDDAHGPFNNLTTKLGFIFHGFKVDTTTGSTLYTSHIK